MPMEPGLSSRTAFRPWPERPSSRLTRKGWGVLSPTSRSRRDTAQRGSVSAALARLGVRIARGDKALERRDGRAVDETVDPLRAEMTLKTCQRVARGAVQIACRGDVVAIVCQQGLRLLDGGIGVAKCEDLTCWLDRRGLC